MKKNLFFGFILIALLVVAYQTEELGRDWFADKNKQSVQLNSEISQVKKIIFKDFELRFNAQGYTVGSENLPGDQIKIDQFFHYLGFIKLHRELDLKETDPKEYGLKHQITVEFADLKKIYTIGEKISFDQNFYMQYQEIKDDNLIRNLYAVARNTAPRFEAYDPQQHDDRVPYTQAVNLFNLNAQFFTNKKILGEIGFVEEIKVTNKRNRDFIISLKDYQTTPKIISGIEPNKQSMEQFSGKVKRLTALNVQSGDLKELSNKTATISLEGLSKIELPLYKKFNSKEGYFVYYKELIYELTPISASVFFSNVQDFWMKKPFGKGVQSAEVLKGNLSQGKQKILFSVPPGETFKIVAKEKVYLKKIQKVFIMLFGSSPKDNANRVVASTERKLKQLSKNKSLLFEFAGRKLKIFDLNDEVVVYDYQRNVLFYYLKKPSWTFPFDIKEYLQ